MPDEFLTIKQVAALRKLAGNTVYAMAQAGEVPACKMRGQLRISHTKRDQWMDAQARGNSRGGGDGGR